MNKLIFLILSLKIGQFIHAQNVAIGTATPAVSAQLDVSSTSKGFLPPRMTTAQRNAINDPTDGLIIFNTTTGCPNYYYSGTWMEWCGNGPSYPEGTFHCSGTPTAVVNVTNPTTGKIWMDRNLGASQAATNGADDKAYGDLYQWGRRADGHQCRASATTGTLSNTDQPMHDDFIFSPNQPNDWLSPQNDNLWQGVNGLNNPCPGGYRLPSAAEFTADRLTWSSQNAAGAFASPLKWTVGGNRASNDGLLISIGVSGRYWSSSISGTSSSALRFDGIGYGTSGFPRANGFSVRCIKN